MVPEKLSENEQAYPPGGILSFYLSQQPNSEGRGIEEIWMWDDERLEYIHNYIQWLFPLRERSRFNLKAPTLTDEVVAAFKTNPLLKARLLHSLQVMLKFYGLQCHEAGGKLEIIKAENYPSRKRNWLNLCNHNYLRLTRILTSLTVLGLTNYAQALFKCLDQIYQEEPEKIGQETYKYWKNALLER